MSRSFLSRGVLPPPYETYQTLCYLIGNITKALLRQSSAMDGDIAPLHWPCCMKLLKRSVDKWSSHSCHSIYYILACCLHSKPTTVSEGFEDLKEVNSYQTEAESSTQPAFEDYLGYRENPN